MPREDESQDRPHEPAAVDPHDATLPSDAGPLTAPPERDEVLGTTLEHFAIEGRVGSGGMGSVYRARDLSLDRPVAVKVIDPAMTDSQTLRERFVREARAQARLSHPGVVQIYYVGQQAGRLFFAMELVDGESLDALVARDGPLGWTRAIEMMIDAARALGAAHRAGVVHRDIKPSNLLLDREGRIRVADFGLAKTSGRDSDVQLTQEGSVLGSPLYMSPEQGQGEEADHRSDIYSLGATFFHLLTGRPPFEGKTPVAVIAKHISAPPPRLRGELPDLPEGLGRVIDRMLAKDPTARYQGYDELIRDLEAARPGAVTRAGFWVRGIAAAVDGALLAVLAAVLGWWALPVFALYAVLGWWRFGKTVGKWLFRLAVRTVDDRGPSLPRGAARLLCACWGPLLILAIAAVRDWLGGAADFADGDYEAFSEFWAANRGAILAGAPYPVIALVYLVGLAWAGFSRRRRAWHDLVCKTMVVYDLERRETKRD